MTSRFWALVAAYFVLVALIAVPLDHFLTRVFAGENRWSRRVLGPLERLLYRAAGVDPAREHGWKQYAGAVLLFSLVTQLATYGLLRLQHALPYNPTHLPPVAPWLAFNTATSFTTNTNWQSYGGETTMPFTARTRMSGIDAGARVLRKGASDAVLAHVRAMGDAPPVPSELEALVDRIAGEGGTPLVVADGAHVLGVIYLKDTVKPGMRERFERLRAMGIKTVMITGDNPLTAKTIAAEAGVDDFLAEATPEAKLAFIHKMQEGGRLVAMTGDGTNDAPALARADVGVAMNTGTQAAKEAGNMVDLDSDPTKLIEVVEIGKQLLMTRGALTTFSIANDVAKYFSILPAMFTGLVAFQAVRGDAHTSHFWALNVMRLGSPQSAILSAVVFNALVIVALIPLALRGVAYRPLGAAALLRRNLLVYGAGGVLVPFVGIKAIDLVVRGLHLA